MCKKIFPLSTRNSFFGNRTSNDAKKQNIVSSRNSKFGDAASLDIDDDVIALSAGDLVFADKFKMVSDRFYSSL